jgi:hypothetical protein
MSDKIPMQIVLVFNNLSDVPELTVIHDFPDYENNGPKETQKIKGYQESGRIFQELADYCLAQVTPKGTS